MSEIVRVALDAIDSSRATQLRADFDWGVVEEYALAWQEGAAFPPVELYRERSGTHWIADGWHRMLGAVQAGMDSIPARVHEGGKLEAIRAALGCNARHGLRRTQADRRKEVGAALRLWPEMSDRAVAEACVVDRGLVAKVRGEMEESGEIARVRTREGRDGVVQRVTPPEGYVRGEDVIPPEWVHPQRAGTTWAEAAVGTGVPVEDGLMRRDLILEGVRTVHGAEAFAEIFRTRRASAAHGMHQQVEARQEEARASGAKALLRLGRRAEAAEEDQVVRAALRAAAELVPARVLAWVAKENGLETEGDWVAGVPPQEVRALLLEMLCAPALYQLGDEAPLLKQMEMDLA